VLEKSLNKMGIPPHKLMLLAGIGCSGTIQNNLKCYGYHALHGRVLPATIGAKLANPDLTVIAAGGDGDGFAIGAGHLVHTFKSNPSIMYIVMNNSNYGLTKGQASPTSPIGYHDNAEAGLDSMLLGLSFLSTTFLARGFSGNPEQLGQLMEAAIEHTEAGRGFAFLEVLSPCVTYYDTHREWRARVYNLDTDESYNPTNRTAAFKKLLELKEEGHIPIGRVFKNEHPSLESILLNKEEIAPAQQEIGHNDHRKHYDQFIKSHLG
jgi:2-oxoglutarate ferredoxin oxidoreductase subunit beta